MLNHVSFADNSEWNDLLNAIRSGGGGGGGSPISIDSTQWQNLLDGIDKGDNTGVVNALSSIGVDTTQFNSLINAINSSDTTGIATNINNIASALNVLNMNNTQWSNLVNAIASQQISVSLDLNNVNTDNTYNRSNFSNQYVTGVLNQIYNALFTIDTNIIQWTKITSFSLVDVYLFKIGIIKFLWLDTAKSNIPTGWITGSVGTLPTGYASILNPPISVNKSYRTGIMTINVSNTGVLNFNCNSSIASGSFIRVLYIYI